MKKLIITIDNIREFRPLPASMQAARILPYIQEAQQIDLKNLLGDALYLDFMTKFDDSAQGATYTAYQDLLNGKSYSYAGQNVEHPGLVGFMAYSALARFFANNQVNATSFGVVQKEWEGSTPVSSDMIRQTVTELRSNALALRADIEKYLTANSTTYPLWAPKDGPVTNGAMFFDPDDEQMKAANGRDLISW